MAYNTTIQPKLKICPLCADGKPVPTTKGLCQRHYWEQIKLKSVVKAQEKQLAGDVDLQTLVDDMDIIFSRYIRLKEADENGIVQCYTCPDSGHWKQMQCGHFIPRAHMPTRFSEKNCRQQCKKCNEDLRGNLIVFAERLEAEEPGLVAILEEQARGIQDYDRDQLKRMIADTTRRVKQLQNGIYQ